ncbi:MAG TPA: CYTH domain-containing protein [bacterium]|nr:CYTH domain-containing protein [bacterium]
MGLEIERKFLVTNNHYKSEKLIDKIEITQGYITLDKEKVIRIRIADDQAYLTLKGLATEVTRHEFEYNIPVDEAREMLKIFCYQPIIKKTRYLIEYKDHIWEIDEFHNENDGLEIAEIELDSEDENFSKPAFIGNEVTTDRRYYNFNLVVNPYQDWKKN